MRYHSLPLKQLPSWARLNQIQLANAVVEPQIFGDQGKDKGGGLQATTDLNSGDIILTIPQEAILCKQQVEEHAKSDRHLREVLEAVGPSFSQNPRKSVMIFLLLQLTHSSPDCSHKEIGLEVPLTQYIQFLPKDIPLPTFYTPEQRELLIGTSLADALGQKLISLEQEFEHLKSSSLAIPWCRDLWWDEDDGVLALDDWKLVDALYRSRAVELPRNIGDSMVPVLDMANHAADDHYNARFEPGEEGEVMLVVRDNKVIRSGEEITIMYGCGGACEMIFSYGFLDDNARSAREMFLHFDMPEDDPLAIAKVRFSKEAPGVRIFVDDKGQVQWDSPFVWWACVNEEDGLRFEITQTTDGARELQAIWQGQALTASDDMKALLEQDPAINIFRLRATVLVQQRVELQGSRLSGNEEIGDGNMIRNGFGSSHLATNAIRRLRDLELELLLGSHEALETEKEKLMMSEAVRTYLSQDTSFHDTDAADEEDFS